MKKLNGKRISLIVVVALLISVIVGVSAFAAPKTSSKLEKRSEVNLKAPYVSGEVVVKVKTGKDINKINKATGGKVAKTQKRLGLYKIKLPKGLDVNDAVRIYKSNPDVEYAEPNYLRKFSYIPNDPYLSKQWGLGKAKVKEAWDINKGSSAITIAILDSGLDLNHPEVKTKVVYPYNAYWGTTNPVDVLDDYGHGTHVTGIAAASLNNGIGIAGIGGAVKVLPVKLDEGGNFGSFEICDGIYWAVTHGARVINMSFGGYQYSDLEDEYIQWALSKNVVLVAAVGNDGVNSPMYPAAYSGVIGVAATDEYDYSPEWSNYGSYIDVSAPGNNIYSTVPGSYANATGTSMASPAVAGLAGLVLSAKPSLANSQVSSLILNNARDLGDSGWDTWYGYGIIDAYKTLVKTVNVNPVVGPVSPSYLNSPPNTAKTIAANYSDANGTGNLSTLQILISTSTTNSKKILAYYNKKEDKFYLRNDANTGWIGGLKRGTAATITNSYGILDVGKTTVSYSGNTTIIKWNIKPRTSVSGVKNNIYLLATDRFGGSSGWKDLGDWVVNRSPVSNSQSPSSTTVKVNTLKDVTLAYSDADGWSNLNRVYLMINYNALKSIVLMYDTNTNKVYMRDTYGLEWMGGTTPGTTSKIANSYATVFMTGTTVSKSGTNVSLKYRLSFTSGFKGTYYSYITCKDDFGASSGNWKRVGSLTIN